jgi:hypothetical protein
VPEPTGRAIPRAGRLYCPTCGSENRFDAIECKACHLRLDLGKNCAECGGRLDSSAKYCPSCGSPQVEGLPDVVDPRIRAPMSLDGDEHPLAADSGSAESKYFAPAVPPVQPDATSRARPTLSEDDASTESWTN